MKQFRATSNKKNFFACWKISFDNFMFMKKSVKLFFDDNEEVA